jgi:hypothetical protein
MSQRPSFSSTDGNRRVGDADSMSARDARDPTLDAGYTTAGIAQTAELLVSLLHFWGSPYTRG